MTPAANWAHLADVPEVFREALGRAEEPFRLEDQELERATIRTLRETRLRSRVPVLVDAAMAQGLCLVDALNLVALHLGLSYGHTRRLFYRGRP